MAANARTDAEALKKASEVRVDKLTRDLAKATEGWQATASESAALRQRLAELESQLAKVAAAGRIWPLASIGLRSISLQSLWQHVASDHNHFAMAH